MRRCYSPGQLGAGISIVLFTAAISAAVSAAFSSFPFGVANPDSNTTAILAVVLAAVAERTLASGRPAEMLPTVLAALILSALVTGTALLALGSFRAGKWVRYFPYPVMGGYLAATGWLIASGAFKVAAGAGLTFETL
ncbi:MAG: hypothetical protein FJZ00_07070, partial [Candidatus Sericytochromatia bacterium]|nr:hypothetical protein [Candidatus Tanganyikabacteria bacterium]